MPDYDYEHSELTLYRVRVLEELGELEEALSMLDNGAKSRVIVDRTAVMETRGEIYIYFIFEHTKSELLFYYSKAAF